MNLEDKELIATVRKSAEGLIDIYKKTDKNPNFIKDYDILRLNELEDYEGMPYLTEIKIHPLYGYILVWRRSQAFMENYKHMFTKRENIDIAQITHVSNYEFTAERIIEYNTSLLKTSIEYYVEGVRYERIVDKGIINYVKYKDNLPKVYGTFDGKRTSETRIFYIGMPEFMYKIKDRVLGYTGKSKSKDII